jgi:hypothetical protein
MAVKIRPNGPYLVEGEVEVVDVNGNKIDTRRPACCARVTRLSRPGVLPKVLLTGRSLESLPPDSRPGSASRAPSEAPECCSPRSSR